VYLFFKKILFIVIFCITIGETTAQVLTLNKAIVEGDKAMVSSMLYNGQAVNQKDQMGNYPICIAAYYDNTEILQELINYGANIHQQNKMNNTALIIAAAKGFEKHVQLLINNGADPNDIGYQGFSALMYACAAPEPINFNVIEILIFNGADVNYINNENNTALDLATNEEIIDYLKQFGALSANDLNLDK